MMKWLIAEDALRDRKGHWLEYVSTFVRELRALGDEVVVLCDQRAQGFVMEQTGARPVLPESIWHRMGDGAGAVKRYLRALGHAWATFVAVGKVFREQFSVPPATSSPLDWIFVPTVLVHHLLGWWLLLKTGSLPKEARVLLFFPNLPIRLDEEGWPHWSAGPTTKLMAWLFANLRGEVESGKVVLGVETHAMRRALEGLIRMPVVYLPHPVDAKPGGEESRVERRESSKREDVFTTTGKAGALEEEYPKGEGVGTSESKDTEATEELESGLRWAGQAGASESGALASKFVELPVSESLIRSTDAPDSFLPATSHLPPITAPEALNAFLPATSYPPPGTSAKPIVFGCYGAARWEKGSDIFQEAIKLILKNEGASGMCRVSSRRNQSAAGLSEPVTNYSLHPTASGRPLRFAIQWVEDFQDDSGNLVSIDPWLREHSQVEVIGRYFEGDEYERRLAATDVMVLPYRKPYQLRVSRVVIEAMLSGMPVIATRGTTLFEQAEEYGVVVGCEEGNAESLADAMLEVAAKFEILRARAAEKVNAAAESFSVGHFRDLLHSKMCFASMSPS
jgi:glycosyltransferase involved in cell wall biosynthesis